MSELPLAAATAGDVVREVTDAIRACVGRPLDGLSVECDGEVITVRGEVDSYYRWQLAFSASCRASRRFDRLLLDFRVVTRPVEQSQ